MSGNDRVEVFDAVRALYCGSPVAAERRDDRREAGHQQSVELDGGQGHAERSHREPEEEKRLHEPSDALGLYLSLFCVGKCGGRARSKRAQTNGVVGMEVCGRLIADAKGHERVPTVYHLLLVSYQQKPTVALRQIKINIPPVLVRVSWVLSHHNKLRRKENCIGVAVDRFRSKVKVLHRAGEPLELGQEGREVEGEKASEEKGPDESFPCLGSHERKQRSKTNGQEGPNNQRRMSTNYKHVPYNTRETFYLPEALHRQMCRVDAPKSSTLRRCAATTSCTTAGLVQRAAGNN